MKGMENGMGLLRFCEKECYGGSKLLWNRVEQILFENQSFEKLW